METKRGMLYAMTLAALMTSNALFAYPDEYENARTTGEKIRAVVAEGFEAWKDRYEKWRNKRQGAEEASEQQGKEVKSDDEEKPTTLEELREQKEKEEKEKLKALEEAERLKSPSIDENAQSVQDENQEKQQKTRIQRIKDRFTIKNVSLTGGAVAVIAVIIYIITR